MPLRIDDDHVCEVDPTMLAAALNRWLEERGSSAHELAVQAGVADSTISVMRSGRGASRKYRVLASLEDATGIPMPELGVRFPVRWASRTTPKPLELAEAVARVHGHGFVGVEHLVVVLAERPLVSSVLGRRVHALCGGLVGLAREVLFGLLRVPGHSGPPRRTPRLERLEIDASLTLSRLWDRLARDESPALDAWFGLPLAVATADELSHGTLEPEGTTAANARRLELFLGPDDGRVITPGPGDELGRAAPGVRVAWPLYARSSVTDKDLSRRHLCWRGPGEMSLLRSGWRWHRRELHLETGEVRVRHGQLWRLSRATWVVARD